MMVVRSAHPFSLAFGTACTMTQQFALHEKGLVGELGLVLEQDPVTGLVVLHCMLQDHDFQHLLGLEVRECALGDEGVNRGR